MMSFAGATLVVVGFVLLIKLFSLVEMSRDVFSISKLAASDIRNPAMDDDAKEIALQKHAKRLFYLFFLISLGGILALLIPLSIIWLLQYMHALTIDDVFQTLLSWQFLLGGTVLAIFALRGSWRQ